MINIGIEKHHGLVYEGDGNYGRGLWPTPVITPAKFVIPSDGNLEAHKSSDPFGYRFREDSFDPISRIRRGRFYHSGQSQPINWTRVSHHPGFLLDAIDPQIHAKSKSLETFYGNPIWYEQIQGKSQLPNVLLGLDSRFTTWKIIHVEAIATGEDLVTLKSQSYFGILPSLNSEKIPVPFRKKLNETIDVLLEEVHRSSPVSVIDRARDVATYILLSVFDLQKENSMDLGALIKKLEANSRTIAANSANIIARLHARAKPTEQEKRELLPICEQDAELAIQCLASLMREMSIVKY